MPGADDETEIRVGGRELIDQLEPLWLDLFDHHADVGGGGLPVIAREASWPSRRALYEQLLADPRAFVLVAVRERRPVGYVVAHVLDGPDDTWPTGDLIGEIETLSLVRSERGKGLGTRLLDLAEARLAELGARCIWIKALNGNEGAHRFYESRGMRPVITTFIRLP
ncbi:MAG: GNAT family N-acetyltransferase [Nocardioides sp.]